MKTLKTQLMKNVIFLFSLALLMSFKANAQEQSRPKNNLSLGAGVSIPLLTSETMSDNYGSNGSNFYVDYSREVFSKNKAYWTVGVKYINISNPYSMLDYDVTEINLNSSSSLGVWSGTVDDFKMSSYLVGFGYNNSISKNKKWISFLKIYVGNGSLTSPTEKFTSTKGYYIEAKEAKSTNITYSFGGGLSYNLTRNIAIGGNVDYIKSSFYFENQELVFSGGGSQNVSPFTINYSNLSFNGELVFKL